MSKKKARKEFPMDVKDSAHKIWLAGLGAVAVAEEEGSKFFKSLVKKGEKFEDRRRKQVDEVVDKVKDGVEDVRDEVESRWQRFGDSFDSKVGAAIERLGVPSREEIHKLTQRVEDLTKKLDSVQRRAKTTKTTKPAKAAAKPRARKSA